MKLHADRFIYSWRARQLVAIAFYLAIVWGWLGASANANPIGIFCDDGMGGQIQVGNLAWAVSGDGTGMTASFTSIVGMPPSLAAAAAACGEHHFNWFQVASGTHPLIPGGGPQIDPQIGGQGGQWADNLPWYWDEGPDPPAMTPGWSDGYHLDDNTTVDTLDFQDFPGSGSNANVNFQTWLVSLNADGSLHGFHEGFSWNWTNNTETNPDGTATAGGMLTPQAGQQLYNQLVAEPSSVFLVGIGLALYAVRYGRGRWKTDQLTQRSWDWSTVDRQQLSLW